LLPPNQAFLSPARHIKQPSEKFSSKQQSFWESILTDTRWKKTALIPKTNAWTETAPQVTPQVSMPFPDIANLQEELPLLKSKLAVPQIIIQPNSALQKLQEDMKSLASQFISSQTKLQQATAQGQKTISHMKTHATTAQRAATSVEETKKRMLKYQKLSKENCKRIDAIQTTSERHKHVLKTFRSAHVDMAANTAKVAVETQSALKKHASKLDDWAQAFRTKHLELDNKLDLFALRHTPEHIDTIVKDKLEPIAEGLKDHMRFSVEYTDKKTSDTNKILNERFDALSSQMFVILFNQRHTSPTLTMTLPQTLALTSPIASKRSHNTSTLTDMVSVATVEILDRIFSTKQYVRPKNGQTQCAGVEPITAGMQQGQYRACMANCKSQTNILRKHPIVYTPQYTQWKKYLHLRRIKHTTLINS